MSQDKKGPEDGDRAADPADPDDDLLDDDELYLKAKDRETAGHRDRAHGDDWSSGREHRKRDRRARDEARRPRRDERRSTRDDERD